MQNTIYINPIAKKGKALYSFSYFHSDVYESLKVHFRYKSALANVFTVKIYDNSDVLQITDNSNLTVQANWTKSGLLEIDISGLSSEVHKIMVSATEDLEIKFLSILEV